MAGQRYPSSWLYLGVGGLDFVVGGLLLLGHLDGSVLTYVSVVMVVAAVIVIAVGLRLRRYEKATVR